MIVYHEVDPSTVPAVLSEGVKRHTAGPKTDELIRITDAYLDELVPPRLAAEGVNRRAVIYAYIAVDDNIIDITHGETIPLTMFIARSDLAVLSLEVDPQRCYVSDLDAYDTLKNALESRDEPVAGLERLAAEYWSHLTPLANFSLDMIARPEVMLTYDVPPGAVRHVKS